MPPDSTYFTKRCRFLFRGLAAQGRKVQDFDAAGRVEKRTVEHGAQCVAARRGRRFFNPVLFIRARACRMVASLSTGIDVVVLEQFLTSARRCEPCWPACRETAMACRWRVGLADGLRRGWPTVRPPPIL